MDTNRLSHRPLTEAQWLEKYKVILLNVKEDSRGSHESARAAWKAAFDMLDRRIEGLVAAERVRAA